jgi:hypothetical protein
VRPSGPLPVGRVAARRLAHARHIPDPGPHRTLFYGEYPSRVRGTSASDAAPALADPTPRRRCSAYCAAGQAPARRIGTTVSAGAAGWRASCSPWSRTSGRIARPDLVRDSLAWFDRYSPLYQYRPTPTRLTFASEGAFEYSPACQTRLGCRSRLASVRKRAPRHHPDAGCRSVIAINRGRRPRRVRSVAGRG